MPKAFDLSISQWVEKTKLKMDVVLRAIALQGYASVIKMSPVDTGRFRGSWRISVDARDLTSESEIPKTSGGSFTYQGPGELIAAAKEILSKATFGSTIYITNNLVYATRLEDGWSKQAPNGMVRLTIQILMADLENLVAAAGNQEASGGA